MSVPMISSEPVATEAVPAVRWEPCSAFHEDPADANGECAGCGWSPDDHAADGRFADAA